MRALVVGLGSIGRRHARNWVALGLGEVLVYRATQAPLPEPPGVDVRYLASLEDGLAERPDLVLVCSPTSLHVPTAIAAVQAGCHVFVEKPIGTTIDDALRLLIAAKLAQRHVFVGYQLRFHLYLQRLRDLLAAGTIGKPLYARASVGEYLPGWHPWEDYRRSYSGRTDLGGGPILTLSHDLDYLCWLLGYPTSVTAVAAHVSGLEIGTEDVAEITLNLASGALASVHLDYLRRPAERSLEIVGAEGVIRWRAEAGELATYAARAQRWSFEPPLTSFERNDLFMAELKQAVAVLDGGSPGSLADGYQGAAILAVALAAHQSAREGRTIPFTPPPEP